MNDYQKIQKLQAKKQEILTNFSHIHPNSINSILFRHIRDTATCCNNISVCQENSNSQEFFSTLFCKHHLLCPICANRRMILHAAKIQQNSLDNMNHAFITLTIRNTPGPLYPQFEKLKTCFQRLYDRIKKNLLTNFSPEDSFCYSIEIKRSSISNFWHPHIHCLYSSPRPINHEAMQKELSKIWLDITEDSFITSADPLHDDKPLLHCIMEVISYAVKFSQLDTLDMMEIYGCLYRRRLFGASGIYRPA